MRKFLILSLLLVASPIIGQESLDVSAFKKSVVSYSRDLKAGYAEYEAVQYAIKHAKSAYYPVVSGTGTFKYSFKDRNYAIPTTSIFFPLERDDFALGAELVQPVYAGGAIKSVHKSAELQGDIAEAKIQLTVDNLLHGAELAYWGAVAQLEMYKVAQRYVDIVAELRNLVETRYLEGKISKTDYIQTESRLAEAKLQLVECKTYYELALQNMNIMMGKNPYDEIVLSDSISSNLELPILVNASDILHLHPEVTIAELGVKNQELMVKKSASAYNPTLYAGLSESWGSSAMNVDNKGYWGHSLFVKLSVPIFNMGARYKAVKSEKERLNVTQYNLQKQVDKVVKDVTDAWTVINENVQKILVAEDNVKIADENLDLNTFSYNEGKLTILDVLSAQATWLSAYTNMISIWHSQHVAIADYNKATASIDK